MTDNKRLFSVYNLVLIAIFVVLITVCTWITIPVGTIPFTLQTFAVFVTGGLLGAKRGTIAVIVYILLGIIGVPVFSAFSSGIVKFIPNTETGMTGGYIIGFVFTTIIIGIFKNLARDKDTKNKALLIGEGMVVGDIVCLAFGTIWFWLFNPMHLGLGASIVGCVVPFIIPEIVKIIVALILVLRLEKIVKV
ncbi:MAG: biotin transporter BioY [Eubacterium sp.]|nr:biotin transporter BioY [Eubacterium sp.]